jgi:inositol 1,4,5-triphosphate receptor type 1
MFTSMGLLISPTYYYSSLKTEVNWVLCNGKHSALVTVWSKIVTNGFLSFLVILYIIHTRDILLSFQLFDVVYREETLLNVIRSVTRNGRSIILTAVLALILVYMFSIIGYMFFKDDFLLSVDQDSICKYLSVETH